MKNLNVPIGAMGKTLPKNVADKLSLYVELFHVRHPHEILTPLGALSNALVCGLAEANSFPSPAVGLTLATRPNFGGVHG